MLLRFRTSSQRWFNSSRYSFCRSFSSQILTPESPIDIEWGGTWWAAHIKENDDINQRFLVSYENWSTKWDEWVDMGSSRIRNSHLVTDSTGSVIPEVVAPEFVPAVDLSAPVLLRPTIELSLSGRTFLSSELRNGAVVLLDQASGKMFWTPPLTVGEPVDWVERRTDTGALYYFNPLTETCQFERPTVSVAAFAANLAAAKGEQVYFSKDGIPYYQNAANAEVAWQPIEEQSKQTEVPTSQIEKPPQEERNLKTPLHAQEPATLPEGWEMYYADSGFPYYYCVSTQTSHWEIPAEISTNWWETEDAKPKAVPRKKQKKETAAVKLNEQIKQNEKKKVRGKKEDKISIDRPTRILANS